MSWRPPCAKGDSFGIQSIVSDGWWVQGPIAAEGTGLLGLREEAIGCLKKVLGLYLSTAEGILGFLRHSLVEAITLSREPAEAPQVSGRLLGVKVEHTQFLILRPGKTFHILKTQIFLFLSSMYKLNFQAPSAVGPTVECESRPSLCSLLHS